MKEITRKQFMGGMAATVALGWRGGFAAPARRQRNYDDMTWWDPYVENIPRNTKTSRCACVDGTSAGTISARPSRTPLSAAPTT